MEFINKKITEQLTFYKPQNRLEEFTFAAPSECYQVSGLPQLYWEAVP